MNATTWGLGTHCLPYSFRAKCFHRFAILSSLQIVVCCKIIIIISWPRTTFDLTCSPSRWTEKKTREKSMFQCNKLIIEVSSHLFIYLDHATSVWVFAGVACLHLTQTWYTSFNWMRTSQNAFCKVHRWSACLVRPSLRRSKPHIFRTYVRLLAPIYRLAPLFLNMYVVTVFVWDL